MIKKITHRILALIYLGAIILSVLFVVKPGAAIFYYKMPIDNQSLVPDAGLAYRYDLKVSPLIFRTKGILLYEGESQLNHVTGNIVVEKGTNTYSLSEQTDRSVHIYLAPSDNSNPIINGRKYTLYLPLNIISRPMGFVYLILLLPGMVWFLYFALALPDHRRTLSGSLKGILTVLDHFLEHISETVGSNSRTIGQQVKSRWLFWKELFSFTILAAYFYIFMEWLFFVTMPSFMSLMSLFEKVEIYLISGFALSLFVLIVIAVFLVLDLITLLTGFSRITTYLGTAFPTIILSSLALMLIDNFTYSVFSFGISTSAGIWRAGYALLFVLLFWIIWSKMLKTFGVGGQTTIPARSINRLFYFSVGILIISLGFALTKLDFKTILQSDSSTETTPASQMPNIILLGSDGLDAENLSVYGYARNTTPQLNTLAKTSLVAENAFTNAGNTAGSVISIFTSKLPTQTRVLYPPDILTGINSYQHLPGILKNQGYTTIEYGVPYYIDAYSYNLQDGFDIANNRSLGVGKLVDFGRMRGFDSEVYLLSRLTWRLSDRILHIFLIQTMENPFDIVTHPVRNISDKDKVSQLLAQVDQVDGPVFIHAHLLGTHGGLYSPPKQYYSLGESQTQLWMVDFYDDTLRAFDSFVSKVIQHLKETGEYENTILIIYTDHNQEFKVNERIPLIIHFPGDEYAGEIIANAQNLDIAPTILDYLGVPEQSWMGGESLLKGDLSKDRLIFSMATSEVKQNEHDINFLDPEADKPPFYQFSYVDIIDCQKWYSFDLNTYSWTSGDVAGYVEPCSPESLRSFDEIKQALADRLALDGFDISSLP